MLQRMAETNIPSVFVFGRAAGDSVLDENSKTLLTSCNKLQLSNAVRRSGGSPEDWPSAWNQMNANSQVPEYLCNIYSTHKHSLQKISDKSSPEDSTLRFSTTCSPRANPDWNGSGLWKDQLWWETLRLIFLCLRKLRNTWSNRLVLTDFRNPMSTMLHV